MSIMHLVLVGVGGFFGAIARFALSQYMNNRFTFRLPMATLLINLLGSFLLGIMIGASINKDAYLLLGTGFMGAFTTFSTLKLESVQLYLGKNKRGFLLYNGLSYGFGILLAFLGIEVGRDFL